MNQLLFRVNETCSELELVVLTQNDSGENVPTFVKEDDLFSVLESMRKFKKLAEKRDAEITLTGSSNIDPIKEVLNGRIDE